jgi:hypothetical protein
MEPSRLRGTIVVAPTAANAAGMRTTHEAVREKRMGEALKAPPIRYATQLINKSRSVDPDQ